MPNAMEVPKNAAQYVGAACHPVRRVSGIANRRCRSVCWTHRDALRAKTIEMNSSIAVIDCLAERLLASCTGQMDIESCKQSQSSD